MKEITLSEAKEYVNDQRSKKTLILVGNKPPRKASLASAIDAFDFVMRVNRMNHLGPAGNRIDGLFLEANEEFKDKYAGGSNRSSIKNAGIILMRKRWYERFIEWPQYLAPTQYNKIEIINEGFAIKATGFERLTSSILLLGYLLNSNWYKEYQICITCLDIENRGRVLSNDATWAYHKGSGAFEQEYLLNLLESGTITRLADE